MTPEGRVKAKLKKWMASAKWYAYWPVPVGFGKQMVDCLAWTTDGQRNYPFAIEVKKEGVDKPTPRQAAIMREMRKAGVITYVVTMRDGQLVWLEQKD